MGYPLERFKNPADSLLKILSVSYPKTESEELKLKNFVEKYKKNNERKIIEKSSYIKLKILRNM